MSGPDFPIPVEGPNAVANRTPLPRAPFEAVCEAIVKELGTRMPGSVAVDHFPDRPEEYDFEGSSAAVLVLYGGSKFDAEGQRGAQGASEMLLVQIVLLCRQLRPSGENAVAAYGLLHDIRLALHGQSFAGTTGLRPMLCELERRSDDGVYQYRFDFEGRLPSLPARVPGVVVPRGFSTERR